MTPSRSNADRGAAVVSLVLLACIVVLACIVGFAALGPLCALAFHGLADWYLGESAVSGAVPGATPPLTVLATSVGIALAAACAGALCAWPASVAMRRHASARSATSLGALILAPIALPPWLLFAALWFCAGPGTLVGDLAERADAVWLVRWSLLGIVALSWSASLAFATLVIAAPLPARSAGRLGALDAWPVAARLRAAWWRDRHAIVLAAVVATVFLLGETTVFDLAQVRTFGFELRTLDAVGATEHDVLIAAMPAVALITVMLGGAFLVGRRALAHGQSVVPRPAPFLRVAGPMLPLAIGPLALVVLFAVAIIRTPRSGDFVALHGGAAVAAVSVALAVGVVVGVVAVAMRLLLASSGLTRRLVLPLGCVLAFAALVPGTLTARGIESAFNVPAFAFIYDTPAVLVVTLVSRTAVAAVLVASLLDLRERRSVRGLRLLDSARLLGFWRSLRRELLMAALAGFAIGFAWSFGELTASSRVVPPGTAWLATDMLNAIHYQRPDTVVVGAGVLLLAAVPSVAALVWLLRQVVQRVPLLHMVAVSLGMLLVAGGVSCGPRDAEGGAPRSEGDAETTAMLARGSAPQVATRLPEARSLGGPGRGRGQFYGPRAIAAEVRGASYFVIDKDARIQRIAPDGSVLAEWSMPKFDRGKPVGATVSPEGLLVVADTHEHRVMAFTSDGLEVWRFGSYGMGPGEFIHPTDIAFAPDGRMFVAEYGSNDRIQVFDRERRFLYSFGSFGSENGQFLRPQALEYDASRDELYVLDVGNHRVQVLTGDGEFRRAFGELGREEGQMAYPFGLVLEIDGVPADEVDAGSAPVPDERSRTVVVAEHGNHRIQRFDAVSGRVMASCGGLGAEVGRVKYPWALAPAGTAPDGARQFVVVDHGNSRLQFFTLRGDPREASRGTSRGNGR